MPKQDAGWASILYRCQDWRTQQDDKSTLLQNNRSVVALISVLNATCDLLRLSLEFNCGAVNCIPDIINDG